MDDTTRTGIAYGLPIAWIAGLVALSGRLGPVARLLGATVGLLLVIKVGSWLLVPPDRRRLSTRETAIYWIVWPGVRPDLFVGGSAAVDTDGTAHEERNPDDQSTEGRDPDGRTFVRGYLHVLAGVGLAVGSLLAVPAVGPHTASWLLLFGVLSAVHFGVGRILPFGLRWLGHPAPPLFDDPLASRRIGAFWSERWNRPFVGMNRLFVTRPLGERVGMGAAAATAFLVSGVLHELAISYPAGAGWGGPLLYFLVQAALYTVEQRLFPPAEEAGPLLGRLWTYAGVLAPMPLLFHGPFRATFLVPLVEIGREAALSYPPSAYLAAGLWLGAAGHFLVLVASAQVPDELDWDEELSRLSSLNRKLMWTYGGFIVLTIVSFGVLTILFHRQLVVGTPVAVGLAAFVAVFWTARVLVDGLYFDHDDWPDGAEYVAGHALLTSLFCFLILVYGAVVVRNVLLGA